MSWLFGRRSDEDDFTSSEEEGEEDELEATKEMTPEKERPLNGSKVNDMNMTTNNDSDQAPDAESENPAMSSPPSSNGQDTNNLKANKTVKVSDVDVSEKEPNLSSKGKPETNTGHSQENGDIATVKKDVEEVVVEKKGETVAVSKPNVNENHQESPPKTDEISESAEGKENHDKKDSQKAENSMTNINDSGDAAETALQGKDEDQENTTLPTESDDKKEEEEVEEVTSTHEKRSLLVLAAEHDRVDILKAILADGSEERDTLLNSSIPPLHISIAYGSTNAVQCLLRMGADPSVRPDVKKIKSEADAGEEEQLVDIPNMGRFDKMSAWELAFGKADDYERAESKPKKSGWFGGGGSKKSTSIDIAPSKLEGIRHAFTAEGLRCIGSDEVGRLKQLIDSGMPATIDIGGKNLYDWAVEMGALQCEELLRPQEAARNEGDESTTTTGDKAKPATDAEGASSAVLDRSKPGTETLSQLMNRIDELESLSKALSTCLDNLAEEVSVCHGLLLMGGGASALASHVRSLKALKESKEAELDRLEDAWENSEDELAYWVKESGDQGREIAELMSPAIISSAESEHTPFEGTPEEEQAHKQQLRAQAAALENKIRKLRASITDLSEENTRDLEEVERRGLSGGINLVRTLREELREVEFTLNETKSAEALCRAKIKLIQSKMGSKKHPTSSSEKDVPAVVANDDSGKIEEKHEDDSKTGGPKVTAPPATTNGETKPHVAAPVKEGESHSSTQPSAAPEPKPSESISTGQSKAIALKSNNSHGYFTVDLWQILLRIIGLGSRQTTTPSSSGSNVMIV